MIILVLHGALLVPMIVSESDNLLIASLLSILLFLVVIGNLRSPKHTVNISSYVPFWVVFGGVSTYFLSAELHLGPVIAASVVGLLASFIPSIRPSAQHLPAAIYCGSFVGMSSPMIAPNYIFILLACLFSGGVYLLVKDDLNGMGGKLGTVAFSGVLLLTLLVQLMK